VPIPWAARAWARPCLAALAPAERAARARGRRHKTLTDWARQRLRAVRRWWPDRALVAGADRRAAAPGFLAAGGAWRAPVTVVTRRRRDAARAEPAPPRRPRPTGRPRLTGQRLPTLAAVAADPATGRTAGTVAGWYGAAKRAVEVVSAPAAWDRTGRPPGPRRWVRSRDPPGPFAPRAQFAPRALLCPDLGVAPAQVLGRFAQRWHLAVTFAEVRRHRGGETPRQWSEGAIRRPTPARLGLFARAALLAHRQMTAPAGAVRRAARSRTPHPTFADALALVRRELWRHQAVRPSPCACEVVNVPRAVVDRLTETLRYVARRANVELRTPRRRSTELTNASRSTWPCSTAG
jgi:hypothetical protein